MIEIVIPGRGKLRLEHLVLDYNGTLACDGVLLEGVRDRIADLSRKLSIHVLTADTFGNAREGLRGLPCEVVVLPREDQAEAKERYVESIGSDVTVCVGNGRNDRLMLGRAALGVAVVLQEGAAREALEAADVACNGIHSALDLLSNPKRLVATLRS